MAWRATGGDLQRPVGLVVQDFAPQFVPVGGEFGYLAGVVLADEPTGELDTTTAGEVMALLRVLNQEGQTFIIVTHDPSVAAQTDRAVYLRDGRVAWEERRR